MDELGCEGVLRAVPDLDLHEAMRVAMVLSGSYKGAIGAIGSYRELWAVDVSDVLSDAYQKLWPPATVLASMADPIP